MKPSGSGIRAFGIAMLLAVVIGCSDAEQESTLQNPVVENIESGRSENADLVIIGGRIIDMASDDPGETSNKAIVIRDGIIDRIIRTNSGEELPQADRVIDASSMYLLPGYVDAHVHLHPWTLPATVWRRGNLYYGVTTIMDTGPSGGADYCLGMLDGCQVPDPNEWITQYKEFFNNSTISSGPTLYVTGIKLDGSDSEYQYSSHRFQSLEEIPEYVDYLAGLGVDAIKAEKGLSLEYRTRLVTEASARGLQVLGHSIDARESISAGMKFIEHMWPIAHSLADDPKPESFNSPEHDYLMNLDKAPALINLMVENDVYLNPTLLGRYGDLSSRAESFSREDLELLRFGRVHSIGFTMPEQLRSRILSQYKLPDDIDPLELGRLREGLRKTKSFLRQYSEAGGLVIAATDSTMTRLSGISMHREMQLLADAGISPYRILLGATRWPAEMIYKDELIGTLEEGKQADIQILASNPVDDISNSLDIVYVIRKGEVQRSPSHCSLIEPPVSQTCWE